MKEMLTAVYKGDGKKLLKLIEKGGDVNALDRGGRSLLMQAVAQGNKELVKILLDNGADPNLADKKTGWTALHQAAQDFHVVMRACAALDRGPAANLSC